MGEVYEAEQEAPVRRKVALKVIKRGMDTKQVVARFEAERQALAMMDHPAIAKVYDAGATPGGRPYFVMEHVRGVPITEHCDRHRLSIKERLGLFMQVCDGVQHAHHKAVIHRDLKPSNVLVSVRDAKPEPKIIDFGVAKALAHKLTDKTMHTQLGVMIGTPAYMSPEQAEMTGQDIDTRTDVYALGVMLYELLVGALPFEMKELQRGGFEAMVRRIREEEPSKPSTRLSTLGDRSTESAKRRRTELPALRRELTGDLDWITMKAMEKDRTRRYGSPQDLAADIERYLTDRPVLASPPSAAYRAKKFVNRHTWGVAATVGGVLVLIAFAATMALQAKRIAAERDLAQQALADLESVVAFQAGMLSATNPEKMGQRLMENLSERVAKVHRAGGSSEQQIASTLASLDALVGGVNPTDLALDMVDEDILGRAVQTLEERFGNQPLIDARLRWTIGEAYRKLGRYERAELQLEEALEIRKRVLGGDHPDTLDSMQNLAELFRNQGRFEEAESLFQEALETGRRVLGDDNPHTLNSMEGLATVYWHRGRYDEAEPLFLEALETRKRVLGVDHPHTLRTMNNLAILCASQGHYDEAEPLFREALEAKKRVRGDDHPDTLRSMSNLAELLRNRGRFDEAEPLLLETIEIQQRVLGDDHPNTLRAMNNLAVLHKSQGRFDEAELLFHETLGTRERVLGKNHPDTLESMADLARLEAVRGNPAAAMDWLRRAIGAGYADADRILKDPELETLHGPGFDALVERARQSAAAEPAE
jgi:non-specific serine/threonine protein kinase/serine/threonine-protein kinase